MSEKETAAPAVDPNTLKSNEIARSVMATGLRPDGFRVEFNSGTATLHGTVHSEDEKQRILNSVRLVGGVANVTDSLTIGSASGTAATGSSGSTGGGTYTVKAGDTLSEIAKEHYGDASKFHRIFDANRNILDYADKIQVGQVLTIPA